MIEKVVHLKTKQKYAFKTVNKNQISILKKKLKNCQNIIHYYDLIYDRCNYCLITKWAENKAYMIKLAYCILNLLNFRNKITILLLLFKFIK